MSTLETRYGTINGYQNLETHPSGSPSSMIFTERFEIRTPSGTIIPQYAVEEHGRQALKPSFFYENGNIRKAPLQEAAFIETRYGNMSAEMVIFHDDETLKKVFPLNGKLSGYWGEKDEYALSKDLSLPLSCGEIKAKMISITFYRTGEVRSVTLWPQEVINADTPVGKVPIRVGLSLYEDGSVKSVEPARPFEVPTAIGVIAAYDNDPLGMAGDVNSLKFDPQGGVTALSTTTNSVLVTDPEGNEMLYAPKEKAGLCSDLTTVTVPMKIEFIFGKVRFNKNSKDTYSLSECTFEVRKHEKKIADPTYVCS